jgi:hypothetical protein
MKTIPNRVKPKIRDRILAVLNHLYEHGGRREEPSGEAVRRLTGASSAVCDEVIREWRGRLASSPSEAGVVSTSDWIRKLSELAESKTAAYENLVAAVAALRAPTTASNQCLNDIIDGFKVQEEKLRNANTNVARLKGENDKIKRLADDLNAGLSAAWASAQILFAKIDSNRQERHISSTQREEEAPTEPERSDLLQTASVDLAAAVMAPLQNEIQVHAEPIEVTPMTGNKNTLSCDHDGTPGSCQEFVSQDNPKPREEVERLKQEWDGNWEIEHTEGFGAHYAELLAFGIKRKALWAERQTAAEAHVQKRLEEYAAELGIQGSTALAQVLNRLVADIKTLERENCELVDRMNHVEARLDRLK